MKALGKLRRGDVLLVEFDPARGSEQKGTRPAVVVSPTRSNVKAPVALVAPVTSRNLDNIYETDVVLEPGEGGIPLRSKVLLNQLRCVDKERILKKYGTLTEGKMQQLEVAALIAIGVERS